MWKIHTRKDLSTIESNAFMYSSTYIMMEPLQEKILQGGPYFCHSFPKLQRSRPLDVLQVRRRVWSIFIRDSGMALYGSMIYGEGNGGGIMVGRARGPRRQEQYYSESGVGGQRDCFEVTHQNLLATAKHKPYSTTLLSRFTSTRLLLSRTACAHQQVSCTVFRDSRLLKPPSILILRHQIEV